MIKHIEHLTLTHTFDYDDDCKSHESIYYENENMKNDSIYTIYIQ